jgi:three-Cys-motif partner protein
MERWGGAWTEEKLDRVEKYLVAFQIALKKQNFKLVYIDAFCGRGEVSIRGGEELPLLNEGRKFSVGSARRALSLTQPFERYHFIDASEEAMLELKDWVAQAHPQLLGKVTFHVGDVNDQLPIVLSQLSKRSERGVLFLDPFGMQVNWETMREIAESILDIWYLVPTMALNRMVSGKGQMPASWELKLDTFLGTTSWREKWYEKDNQGNLFLDKPEAVKRIASIERIEEDFIARMKFLFQVAPNRLRLKDGNNILFTLVFGCSNPNPRAFGLALKIANNLLKE